MWGKPRKAGKQIVPSAAPAPTGRVVAGRAAWVTTLATVPDAWAVQAASLGIMTNTFSPASTSGNTYTGDRGFGVNRWAGRTIDAVQNFHGAAAPVLRPRSTRLGIGAMTAGQPGLPNTGGVDNLGPVAYMSMSQVANHFSFGGGG
jgi:hypothetical protein